MWFFAQTLFFIWKKTIFVIKWFSLINLLYAKDVPFYFNNLKSWSSLKLFEWVTNITLSDTLRIQCKIPFYLKAANDTPSIFFFLKLYNFLNKLVLRILQLGNGYTTGTFLIKMNKIYSRQIQQSYLKKCSNDTNIQSKNTTNLQRLRWVYFTNINRLNYELYNIFITKEILLLTKNKFLILH